MSKAMKKVAVVGTGTMSHGIAEVRAIHGHEVVLIYVSDEEKWELKRKQGIPVFGVDVKLVDESGRELPWDGKTIGELCIKGPWVTGEYYRDPRTFESFLEDDTGR